eukprot:5943414-Prymnesium_polylepis.1
MLWGGGTRRREARTDGKDAGLLNHEAVGRVDVEAQHAENDLAQLRAPDVAGDSAPVAPPRRLCCSHRRRTAALLHGKLGAAAADQPPLQDQHVWRGGVA